MRFAKSRRELSHGEIDQLRWGYDFFGDGFGDESHGIPLDEKRMREAWEQGREVVEQYHQADVLRADWPIYAELRFDKGLSRQKALKRCSQAGKGINA
jgi:hypothetical protein